MNAMEYIQLNTQCSIPTNLIRQIASFRLRSSCRLAVFLRKLVDKNIVSNGFYLFFCLFGDFVTSKKVLTFLKIDQICKIIANNP